MKTDHKKAWKNLYNPSPKEVTLVDVPPFHYLMIDGQGDPNTAQSFSDAVETLYAMSYGISMNLKKQGILYTVMPLEGLWWMESHNLDFYANKDKAFWTMMILQPEPVSPDLFEQVKDEVQRKKHPAALDRLRFEEYHEGQSAQIMHLGAFDAERPTVDKLHHYIEQNGYQIGGMHHEIYLSDFRRAAPDKLKTVIRYPVKPA